MTRWLAALLGLLSCHAAPPAAPPPAASPPAPVVAPAMATPKPPPPSDPRAALIELLPPPTLAPFSQEAPGWRDDPALWQALVDALRRAPAGPERDELLRRGLAAVATWPDALRVADAHWVDLWRAGEAPFAWPLFRAATIESIEAAERLLARGAFAEMTSLNLYLRGNDVCARWPAFVAALAAAPGLERIEAIALRLPVCAGPSHIEQLAALRALPNLRKLALTSWLGPNNAVALAASPLLARLTELDLSGNMIGREGLVALGASPHLRGLEVLSLAHSLTPADARALRDTPGLEHLRALDLRGVRLEDAGIAALADNRTLAGLRALDLTHVTGVTDAGVARLLSGLPALEVVKFERTAAGDLAFAALVRAAGPNLREVVWRWGQVSAAGLAALAGRALPRLERLDLTHNDLGPAGGRALAQARMPGLRHLKLAETRIGGEAATALIAGLATPSLVTLDLADALAGDPDGAARAIAARTDWTGLRTLGLDHDFIGPDGFVALAAAPQLAGLVDLWIRDNHPGEVGWRALVESPHLAHLVAPYWRAQLALHDTTLSPADAARAIPSDFTLQIVRGDCYGPCPVYRLSVDAGGRVAFVGEKHVARVGAASGAIHPARVRLVLAAIDRFLVTQPAGAPARGPDCLVHASDMPSVTLEVRRDGALVRHDTDAICQQSAPWQALFDLAARVDILVGADRWIGDPLGPGERRSTYVPRRTDLLRSR